MRIHRQHLGLVLLLLMCCLLLLLLLSCNCSLGKHADASEVQRRVSQSSMCCGSGKPLFSC